MKLKKSNGRITKLNLKNLKENLYQALKLILDQEVFIQNINNIVVIKIKNYLLKHFIQIFFQLNKILKIK